MQGVSHTAAPASQSGLHPHLARGVASEIPAVACFVFLSFGPIRVLARFFRVPDRATESVSSLSVSEGHFCIFVFERAVAGVEKQAMEDGPGFFYLCGMSIEALVAGRNCERPKHRPSVDL